MKVTGRITKMFDIVTGETKAGKAWSKVSFLLETSEEYNNLYNFEMFAMDDETGEDTKVSNFIKFNKLNDIVCVEFNIKTTEWKDKYYTSLSAWMVKKDALVTPEAVIGGGDGDMDDDLPF